MKHRLQRAVSGVWADRALWLCAAGLVLLFYNLYLGPHHSPDTWSTAQYFKDIDAAGHSMPEKWVLLYEPFAMQGRFVRGFLMFLLGTVNASSLMVSKLANAMALALFTGSFVCGTQTLRAALRAVPVPATARKADGTALASNAQSGPALPRADAAVCFLGTAVLLCNPFFCDWLQFAECAMIYPLGLLLAVLAARVLVTQWHVAIRVITSGLLAILAAGIYQITLQFFVLFTMAALVLRTVRGQHARQGKRMAQQATVLAAQALLVYVCAVIPQYLFTRVLFHNTRMSSDFAATLALIQTAQRDLWSMRYLGEPSGLFAGCVLVLVALGAGALLRAVWQRRLSPVALGVVGATGAAFYASVFVLMLVTDGAIPHRTVSGFFGIPLFLVVCLVAALGAGDAPPTGQAVPSQAVRPQSKAQDKAVLRYQSTTLVKSAAIVVLCVLLAFGWFHTQRFAIYLVRTNTQDAAIARSIQQCIVQYEQDTGNTVRQVQFYRMPGYHVSYPDVFQSHDLNMRGWVPEWSRLPLLNTVNGTNYTAGVWSDAVYGEQFMGNEWTAFHSEQVYCEGEMAHVAIY